MADTKITALAAITTVDPAADVLPIVDISDTSMAASGTTKKITSNQILGAGGTATLASATITGDLTVDTSTLKVDSANNRVGIGTASPSGILHAANLGTAGTTADNFNGYFSSANRNANLYLLAKNTEGSNFYFGDGDSNTVGGIIYDHASNYMRFDVNGSERIRTDSSGNFSLATGNLVMSTSGKGIDFSATTDGSATATSETLADYEEGYFIASFITGGGSVTINTVSDRCRYTKIGRLVTVQGNILVSSVSSPTGPLLISGLPYTIAAGTEGDSIATMSVMAQGLQTTATGQIVGYGPAGGSAIYMYRYEAGAIIGLAPSAKASSEFAFSMTYSV